MMAMMLEKQGNPLILKDIDIPHINDKEVLVKVIACGVCRTDLHIIDGELTNPKLPLVMGHQIVGKLVKKGKGVRDFEVDDLIGIPWLGYSCGSCKFCKTGKENLCDHAKYTGYSIDGGFAEYAKAHHKYVFKIPKNFDPVAAAPLLCAGLIGFRAYNMVRDSELIGIYGFGSAAHILTQIAIYEKKKIFAFSKRGDEESVKFARNLGVYWSGYSDESPPKKLDAAIIFAPAGELVVSALKVVDKGGKVICGGIHMSDIPSFPYKILWEERMIKSVANLTKDDGIQFFKLAEKANVKTKTTIYKLDELNKALDDLRQGHLVGSAVIKI
ncbi:MAG: zinc-dependent alcohol dehydrogenase family protein [Deltaproteobacteria bacterium]|nr:zinc-dependent alcohol dehydrogenase family protein [Deltaproteobacteria bacterium]